MSATKLSENQCKHIESPEIKVSLQISGVASSLPRDILNGTLEQMVMDGKSLYETQGTKHIIILMDHDEAATITGKQLIAIEEIKKMEIGTGSPLL